MSVHGMCNGCGKGFGFFTKEDTCHSCGLNFCTKCVGNKAAVPKFNNEVKRVCIRCFKILTGALKGDTTQKRDRSPPANFLKNLEAANQSRQHQHRKESLKKKGLTSDPVVKNHLKPEYRNLSKEDMEIAERLEKLKEERREMKLGPNPLPPEQDVEQRLARLRAIGQPVESSPPTQLSNMPPEKKMTEGEETTHLLNQVKDEVNIDRSVSGDTPISENKSAEAKARSNEGEGNFDDLNEIQALIAKAAAELEIDAQKALADLKKDKEIMARIDELKSKKLSKESSEDNSKLEDKPNAEDSADSSDEEDEVKTILQQVLEERILDEQVEAAGGFQPPLQKQKSLNPPEAENLDPDELPWCCICNEDATLRCIDCDMDLYCLRCYKDGHKQLYEDDHKCIPYKKPSSAAD
ncbi:ZFYVE19 [Bugula neritina]|uniref:ZFYVE19 n=1 Tax=Bugula neritina TaxID=10212 RepID=A0A7J7JSD6_BUGNE|nr:ZFYVE19 [Bugula neritina]